VFYPEIDERGVVERGRRGVFGNLDERQIDVVEFF